MWFKPTLRLHLGPESPKPIERFRFLCQCQTLYQLGHFTAEELESARRGPCFLIYDFEKQTAAIFELYFQFRFRPMCSHGHAILRLLTSRNRTIGGKGSLIGGGHRSINSTRCRTSLRCIISCSHRLRTPPSNLQPIATRGKKARGTLLVDIGCSSERAPPPLVITSGYY